MMGPDFVQGEGMYEVAERFYVEFVPEVRELIAEGRRHGKTAAANEVEAMLTSTLNSELHRWSIGKMSPEEKAERLKAMQEFQKRYAGETP